MKLAHVPINALSSNWSFPPSVFIVWKKYQVLSRASNIFLKQLQKELAAFL